MAKAFVLGGVSFLLAASVASGCTGGGDDGNNQQSQQQAQKTCADLQACCNEVADAEKKKNCQVVVDELVGVKNADLGCSTALDVGWSKECP